MSIRTLCLTLASAALLSSCSVLRPYNQGIRAEIYGLDLCGEEGFAECIPLDAAQQQAADLQVKYIKAAGNDELVRNVVGGGIAAAAWYAWLINVSGQIGPANAGDQAAAIGAASSAAFIITSLFTNPQRQRVYLAGAKAIGCVRAAAAPFHLSSSDLETLTAILSTDGDDIEFSLQLAIRDVDSAISELEYLNNASASPDATITSYVGGIRNEISVARLAFARGSQLRSELLAVAPRRLSKPIGKNRRRSSHTVAVNDNRSKCHIGNSSQCFGSGGSFGPDGTAEHPSNTRSSAGQKSNCI